MIVAEGAGCCPAGPRRATALLPASERPNSRLGLALAFTPIDVRRIEFLSREMFKYWFARRPFSILHRKNVIIKLTLLQRAEQQQPANIKPSES